MVGRWLGIAALCVAGLTGAGAASAAPMPGAATRGTFIITCDCSTSAARQRIATAVRRRGGRVLYVYNEIYGLAVAAPRGRSVARFERAIRRIPGVIAVEPDGVSQISRVD